MLMGDLITAVSHDLPVKLVVFDNGRLGMVKLEMEQVGLPEFGTVLHNPDFARVAEAVGMRGIRVESPTRSRRPSRRPSPTTARRWWTASPTPTRSPSRPSPRSSRAGASRSPRRASSSTAPSESLFRMLETQRESTPRDDGGELETALAFLEFARGCLLKKVQGLDEEQLRRRLVVSETTLLGRQRLAPRRGER